MISVFHRYDFSLYVWGYIIAGDKITCLLWNAYYGDEKSGININNYGGES